jgi:hypothetical protein
MRGDTPSSDNCATASPDSAFSRVLSSDSAKATNTKRADTQSSLVRFLINERCPQRRVNPRKLARWGAWGLGVLCLLSPLCSHIISNYSGITYFPELSERGLLPTGVVLSAIRSFESRISLSSFMICRSCIQTNNGMNVKKTRKAQIARPNENSSGFMLMSRVKTYEMLAEPKSGEDGFTSSA